MEPRDKRVVLGKDLVRAAREHGELATLRLVHVDHLDEEAVQGVLLGLLGPPREDLRENIHHVARERPAIVAVTRGVDVHIGDGDVLPLPLGDRDDQHKHGHLWRRSRGCLGWRGSLGFLRRRLGGSRLGLALFAWRHV